jgi:hypothetical protein
MRIKRGSPEWLPLFILLSAFFYGKIKNRNIRFGDQSNVIKKMGTIAPRDAK